MHEVEIVFTVQYRIGRTGITSYLMLIIEQLEDNLIPFEQFSKVLSMENLTVSNEVLSSFLQLKAFFDESNDLEYCAAIVEFRKLIRENLEKRVELNDFYMYSAILDPFYKNEEFLSKVFEIDVRLSLINAVDELKAREPIKPSLDENPSSLDENPSSSDPETNSRKRKSTNDNLASKRKRLELINTSFNLRDHTQTIYNCVDEYLNYKVDFQNYVGPVEFWRKMRQVWPILGEVFRRVGPIQVSNARLERVFSLVSIRSTKRTINLLNFRGMLSQLQLTIFDKFGFHLYFGF